MMLLLVTCVLFNVVNVSQVVSDDFLNAFPVR